MSEETPAAERVVTRCCPQCQAPRLFRVRALGDRWRMVCPTCGIDLPARLGTGPVRHWRDLVDGPPVIETEADRAPRGESRDAVPDRPDGSDDREG